MSIWASNLINSKSKQSTGQFGGALSKLDKPAVDVVQDSGVIDKKAYDIITDGSPAQKISNLDMQDYNKASKQSCGLNSDVESEKDQIITQTNQICQQDFYSNSSVLLHSGSIFRDEVMARAKRHIDDTNYLNTLLVEQQALLAYNQQAEQLDGLAKKLQLARKQIEVISDEDKRRKENAAESNPANRDNPDEFELQGSLSTDNKQKSLSMSKKTQSDKQNSNQNSNQRSDQQSLRENEEIDNQSSERVIKRTNENQNQQNTPMQTQNVQDDPMTLQNPQNQQIIQISGMNYIENYNQLQDINQTSLLPSLKRQIEQEKLIEALRIQLMRQQEQLEMRMSNRTFSNFSERHQVIYKGDSFQMKESNQDTLNDVRQIQNELNLENINNSKKSDFQVIGLKGSSSGKRKNANEIEQILIFKNKDVGNLSVLSRRSNHTNMTEFLTKKDNHFSVSNQLRGQTSEIFKKDFLLEKHLIPKKINTPTSKNLKSSHPHLVLRSFKPADEDDMISRQSFSQLSQTVYDAYLTQKKQYLKCDKQLTRNNIMEFNKLVKEVFSTQLSTSNIPKNRFATEQKDHANNNQRGALLNPFKAPSETNSSLMQKNLDSKFMTKDQFEDYLQELLVQSSAKFKDSSFGQQPSSQPANTTERNKHMSKSSRILSHVNQQFGVQNVDINHLAINHQPELHKSQSFGRSMLRFPIQSQEHLAQLQHQHRTQNPQALQRFLLADREIPREIQKLREQLKGCRHDDSVSDHSGQNGKPSRPSQQLMSNNIRPADLDSQKSKPSVHSRDFAGLSLFDQQHQQLLYPQYTSPRQPINQYDDHKSNFILNQRSVQFIKDQDLKKMLRQDPNSSRESKDKELLAFGNNIQKNSVASKLHSHGNNDQQVNHLSQDQFQRELDELLLHEPVNPNQHSAEAHELTPKRQLHSLEPTSLFMLSHQENETDYKHMIPNYRKTGEFPVEYHQVAQNLQFTKKLQEKSSLFEKDEKHAHHGAHRNRNLKHTQVLDDSLNLTIGMKFTQAPQLQLSKKFTLDSQDLPSYDNAQRSFPSQHNQYLNETHKPIGRDHWTEELISPTKQPNSKKQKIKAVQAKPKTREQPQPRQDHHQPASARGYTLFRIRKVTKKKNQQ